MAKTLTVRTIEAIKPGPSRKEVPDGLLGGLYFIVQPSGASSWALRYRFNGTPKKLTIGPYPALTLAKARELAGKAVTSIAEGRDPGEEKKQVKVAAKEAVKDIINDVVDLYIKRHVRKNMKDKSRNEVERMLNFDVVPAFANRPISKITKRDIVDLIDGIVDRGSPVMANRVLANVQRLFRWAVDRDIITASPAEGIKPPAAERSRDRVLTDDELHCVLNAADGLGWPFGPVTRLLALTGQRLSEIAEMEWSELDFDKSLWTIPAGRTKNGNEHAVPLSPQVKAIIEALPRMKDGEKDSRLVFTTTGKTPVSGWSRSKSNLDAAILKNMQKAAKDRGEDPEEIEPIPAWRMHDLRRTAASGMARLGIQIHVVEKVLNHISGSFGGIVGVYQRHDYADEKRAALSAWGRHVEALDAVKQSNVVAIMSARSAK